MIQLLLGGARSGKSSLAEQLAHDSGKAVHYIATATAEDDEMRTRVARHQRQRPTHWPVIEEPLALTQALQEHSLPDNVLLVDCLTLWLSNHLLLPTPPDFDALRESLCDTLAQSEGDVILVSNEVGQGIVPMGALSRTFVDQAGWLNQAVARCADRVVLVSAGLPLVLKGPALR